MLSSGMPIAFPPVITYTFCSWATMMQHTVLSLFLFRAIFSHGVLAWIFTTSVILEPSSSDFPCRGWDSWVHWDAFRDELVHCRRGGDSRYSRGVLGVCPKINLHGYPQGMCGLNGVSKTVFIIPRRCNKYRCLEVTFQEFPLPLGIFPPFTVWPRRWIFSWWWLIGEDEN